MAARRDIEAGSAYVRLWMKQTEFDRGIRTLKRNLQSIGGSMTAWGKSLMVMGGAILAPLAVATKAASDMQETMSKFDTVFGSNAKSVKTWGDTYAAEVGRSKQQVADFLASSQDLFVPLGFDPRQAEALSKQVTELAVDLASFNNKLDVDTLRDLQAALTGSGEVMKKYGVVLDEAGVKQELLNQAIDPKMATNAEKAYARLAIILRGTTAAQGDAIRTSGSFANQMKALKASVMDAAVEIGSTLIPVITPLVQQAADVAKRVADWAAEHESLIVTVAKAAAGLAAVGGTLYVFGTSMTGAAAAVGVLSKALVFLAANPVIAVVAGLGLLTAAYLANRAAAEKLTSKMKDLREEGERQRAADKDRIDRLHELSEVGRLNDEQMKEAGDIIVALNNSYRDLGITLDRTTNRLNGVADAQAKVNAEMDAARKRQLRDELAEVEQNLARLETRREASTGPESLRGYGLALKEGAAGPKNPFNILPQFREVNERAAEAARKAWAEADEALLRDMRELEREANRIRAELRGELPEPARPAETEVGQSTATALRPDRGPVRERDVTGVDLGPVAQGYYDLIKSRQEELEQRKAEQEELQRIQDEIDRQVIMRDFSGIERDIKLLDQQQKIELRSATSPEQQAKIQEKYDVEADVARMNLAGRSQQAAASFGTTSSYAAAAMSGAAGTIPGRMLRTLDRIAKISESQDEKMLRIDRFLSAMGYA